MKQKPPKLFVNEKACFGAKEFCQYKNENSKKFVFIVGDSIMEGLTADLTPKLINAGFNVVVMNNSLCHFIPEFNSVVNDRQRVVSNLICDYKYQKLRLDKILSQPDSIIIMGGLVPFENFKHYKNDNVTFEENYNKFVMNLLSNDYKIIQLTDTLSYKKNIFELLQRKTFKENLFDENKNIKFDFYINIKQEEFLNKNKRQRDLFNSINHKNYKRFSNFKLFCNTKLNGKCIFNDKNNLFIHDYHHYTLKGSELVNSSILNIIESFEN
tara:strand:- start:14 stop:820 length:807 start_codon:yes stop_codon:yes gene_type:complete